MKRRTTRLLAVLAAGAAILATSLLGTPPAAASDSVSYTRKGATFDEVRADLEQAIIAEGLKVDYRGNLGDMLKRTGKDVGSNQPIFEHAEFVTFCSSRLSRAMMEADPGNMSQCPYVMFAYQRATAYKEVVIGYRKVNVQPRGAKALKEINALLDKIAKAAAH